MNSTSLICLVSLFGLGFAYQVTERESNPPKLRLRPGDLLRSLDELTADAQVIYSPLHEEPPKSRISAERRAYDDESPYDEPASEFDYDRAYEDFVSKYFAQGEDDLSSDERASDIDDAVPYETQAESEEADKPKSKKKSSKSKKCERVEIDDQNCLVCEDPKTNEKSKSCSYSSDSKPKSFAFSRERSLKHSKDKEDDDDDDESGEEAEKSVKREATPKIDQIQPRRTSIKAFVPPDASADGTSKCTRKREDGMICYYCGTPAEHTRECMADKKSPKKRRVNESSKKDSKTKKVFKRMVTYSFKNNAVPEIKENTYEAIRGYKF